MRRTKGPTRHFRRAIGGIAPLERTVSRDLVPRPRVCVYHAAMARKGSLDEIPAHIWHSGHTVRGCQKGMASNIRVTHDGG